MPPFDRVLVMDMETAWDSKTYTLSKMTTEEYVRDARFQAWGMSYREIGSNDGAVWIPGWHLPTFFASVDWSRTAVVAHNSQFDVAILVWRYGCVPAFIFDTLSMARAIRGVEAGNSLEKLAKAYGLPEKGKAVHNTNGLFGTLPILVEQELAEYCCHDVALCEAVFVKLLENYPRKELELIDLTIRMFVQPRLELDADMLKDAIDDERVAREALLAKLGVADADLASNDKFAAMLQTLGVDPPRKAKKPTKKTPHPVGTLHAFAKTDALFQAMLNGDNETLALLCEARLKVKSTLERTRAQRFYDISQRGTLPVPLNYFGTLSMRWSASKGSSLNMQNLKRGSFLRKSIMAPEGHQIIVADLSQIEPRVLAYMAGYNELLGIFRAGKDPYAEFGSTMFNIPGMTKQSHPALRQSAKSALLGCFAAETLVLTQRGYVSIIQVNSNDLLWDGAEWVQHMGVVDQGERETLLAYGVRATADHEILTERGWRDWNAVLQSRSLFKSALSSVNLPVSNGHAAPTGVAGSTHGSRACGAVADGRGLSHAPIYGQDEPRAATHARKEKQPQHALPERVLKRFVEMLRIESGCLRASVLSCHAAQIRTTGHTQTTAAEGSQYTGLGSEIGSSFLRTWCRLKVGINRIFNSIAATTNAGMCRETFASALAAKTWPTSAAFRRETSKRSSVESTISRETTRTYDIAYAGPRNRYTVLTSEGPVVVHNCGYYLGWASFATQLLTGFLGAPPVRYDRAFADMLGVTAHDAAQFCSGKTGAERIERMMEIPHTCTDEELFVHCVCAKRIIDTYRATAWPVASYWQLLNDLIEHSLYGGAVYKHQCLTFMKEKIVLPNGMALQYPDLRAEKDEKRGVQWTYASGAMRKKLHAGVLAENTTSALSRVVMTDGMLRISKRLPVVLTVHDEVGAVAPDEFAHQAKDWCREQMLKEPPFMPSIPLGVDVGMHRRYGLAKD